jgi:hypothetical protein
MEPAELEREIRDLARRVEAIEGRLGLTGAPGGAEPVGLGPASAVGSALVTGAGDPSELLPSLGRALLGLAGAYLLRALVESETLPATVGIGIGILYALGWLVWAARTPAERRIEAALHSLTAALVLSPLLWEATLRFHAVSAWGAGLLLLLFTLFGLAVSWRKNLLIVATIATLAGLGTAAALLIATHDVLPFTFVFLATAAAVEISACLDHWLSERWLAATAADLAVLLATWLVTNESGLPQGYAPIPHGWLAAAQAALLGIYLAGTIVRTLLRGRTFTGFETAQCVAAFGISVGGGLRLSPAMPWIALACGAACYVVSFAVLEKNAGAPSANRRNFFTYSTFGILLVLAGSRIVLSSAAASAAWSVLAVACVWAGARFGRLTMQLHGGIYLLLALASSGALEQAGEALLGGGGLGMANLAAAPAAMLCFWFARRSSSVVFRAALAAGIAWLAAGIAAGGMTSGYHAAFGAAATHAYCAMMRTGTLAVTALGLARFGLVRLGYPAMLLGAWRLAMVDLHQEQKTALTLSLLVYGAALMVMPRVGRRATGAETESRP